MDDFSDDHIDSLMESIRSNVGATEAARALLTELVWRVTTGKMSNKLENLLVDAIEDFWDRAPLDFFDKLHRGIDGQRYGSTKRGRKSTGGETDEEWSHLLSKVVRKARELGYVYSTKDPTKSVFYLVAQDRFPDAPGDRLHFEASRIEKKWDERRKELGAEQWAGITEGIGRTKPPK